MQDRLKELLVVLDKLDRLYRSLNGALENEQVALSTASLAGFLVAKDRKEALLSRLEELAGHCRRQADLLAEDIGLPAADFTVSRLMRRLPAADAGRLKARAERLGKILAQTGNLNKANRCLNQAFQEFTGHALEVLQGLRRPAAVYRYNGRMHGPAFSGTLLAEDF